MIPLPARVRTRVRKRRSVRTRIAIACAVLFLAAGGVLVAATYALSARAPPAARLLTAVARNPQLYAACRTAHAAGTLKVEHAILSRCRASFASAAALAASSQHARDLQRLLLDSLLGLALATLLAGMLGWALARRVLHPLRQITTVAQRASQQNLDRRIELSGPEDEVKALADTFDAMLARLDSAFRSQQQFIANASHELRTPLTVMRTLIDVTLAKLSPPAPTSSSSGSPGTSAARSTRSNR
jgi:signal transduction histidine kinase